MNLKHPNLIALYDVKQDEQDNSWVVMEYATGESLEDVIRRHPNGLPPDEAVDWMQGIAAGVGYLHDHGIVHRDLKPGNIFRDDGQVKLGDYGLSKFISCSRRSGQTESIGTVHYMAPEVANGRYGKEIDIYALGIILYEMLTGHVPFEGESVGEVLMKHLTAEPSLAEVPEAYREVIARALAKDPTRRFASVGEMMNALPPLAATMAYRAAGERKSAGHGSPTSPRPPRRRQHDATASAAPPAQAGTGRRRRWPAARRRSTRSRSGGRSATAGKPLATLGTVSTRPPRRRAAGRPSWSWPRTPGSCEYVVGPGAALCTLYRIARSVVLQPGADKAGRHAELRHGDGRLSPTTPAPPADRPPADPATPTLPATAGHGLSPAAKRSAPGDWRKASRSGIGSSALSRTAVARAGRGGAGRQIAARAVGRSGRLDDVGRRDRRRDERGRGVAARRGQSTKEQYAWLTMVSVLGSWAILIPAKFWEGTQGDAILRRVVLLIVGLGVGGAAYLAADVLMIKFPDSPMHGMFNAREIGSRVLRRKEDRRCCTPIWLISARCSPASAGGDKPIRCDRRG